MKRAIIFLGLLIFTLLPHRLPAEPAPETLWTRMVGQTYSLVGVHTVQETSDGGYVASGYIGQGEWRTSLTLFRLTASGGVEWVRSYPTNENDYVSLVSCVKQTMDHGFVACVATRIYFPAEEWYLLLVRTDSLGNILWQRTYPGAVWDSDWSVCETPDGGFVVAGNGSPAIRKVDRNGEEVWARNLTGAIKELQSTSDGGYVVAGTNDGFFLTKLDSGGQAVWTRTYGTQGEECYSVAQTGDGGYILGGGTWNFGAWYFNFWLVKTNSVGTLVWAQAYGGNGSEKAWSVRQARDGGYVAVGWSNSFDGADDDVYVIKVDGNGDSLWSRVLGGNRPDAACSVEQTDDGGYIVAGYTESFGADWRNAYFIKFARDSYARAFVQLVNLGPPVWNYRLVHVSGSISRFRFTDFCPGTIGSVTDVAASEGWTVANYGDSIVFTNPVPLTAGSIQTFTLSHPYCADMIHWCVEDSCGIVDGPLPVELLSFAALAGDAEVLLRWRTASETGSDRFEIERDGKLVHREGAMGDATGHSYAWTDRGLTNGQSYHYALWSVEVNGKRELLSETEATPRAGVVAVTEYALHANYPNPFNPATEIAFDLPEAANVSLKVFDVTGREVAVLVNGETAAGRHRVRFDARDLPSGMYFCRMRAGEFAAAGKMMLIR